MNAQRTILPIAIALFTIARTAQADAQAITVTPIGATSISTYDRAQWQIDLAKPYRNPFDPDEIGVDATFTGPGGKTVVVPAFWDKPGNDLNGAFYVRFAPPTAGSWSMTVSAKDDHGTQQSSPITFTVSPGTHRGFVRVADNRRYLRFDNGDSYFPIGLNLAWPPKDQREEWYDSMFDSLAGNGGNYARVWMSYPPAMIESGATGLRRYDLKNAAYFDHVLDSAQKHGIGVMLEFMNFRELIDRDMWGPADWVKSPYNAKNRGPATQPIDFFTSDDAQKDFQARLRYIVARYGAYTSVAFWELFNEQEGTLLKIPPEWDRDMARYLIQIDPYHHPVTTSSIVPDAVWQLPEIAITQAHPYGDGTRVELVAPILQALEEHQKFDKPLLIGETGIDYHGGDYTFDPTGKGTAFHNALWSAALSGTAGTAMYWWWDNYIDPKNQWHEFQSIANFTKPIDWAHQHFAPIEIQDLHRDQSPIAYTDMTLPAGDRWGVVAHDAVVVPANGRLPHALPAFFCGPEHHELSAPLVLRINLPQPSRLTLNMKRISEFGFIRVSVDGKPLTDFAFSALPGADGASGSNFDEDYKMYRATVVGPRKVPTTLPAGTHDVKIDPIGGDWVTLGSVTFSNALDSRYAHLSSVAVQDPASHETLAWIWDTRSNWKDDQSHDPEPQTNVQLTIPNISQGRFAAEWWDTRVGAIIRTDTAIATDGKLIVNAPTFTRDIAMRLRPAQP